MPQTGRTEALAADLRTAATRAAELAGGGSALLFAFLPGEENPDAACRLRAEAGFGSLDTATTLAAQLQDSVRRTIAGGLPEDPKEALYSGVAGQEDMTIVPFGFENRVRGAMVVTPAGSLQGDSLHPFLELVASMGLRLDHAHLREEMEALRSVTDSGEARGGEQDDELLKLSEQLFAQDVQLLQNNEKLGKIEKLKNDFIEKMSRELRTPLNSIIEAIISVIAGESGQLTQPSVDSLRGALDEGTAFQRTLQNILDLWRIKQNELPVGSQDVNFPEIVEEAIFSVQESLGAKPVVIEKQFEQPFPKIRTDLAIINQLLFLLLDNAVKFTDQGQITIAAQVFDGNLVCQIEDTGIGMCADDRQLIFDEFFQVDESSSNKYRGAGLGLTLVRDLLVLLGGEISVSSETGDGTCMTFRVPVEIP